MSVGKNDQRIVNSDIFEGNLEFIWILHQYPGEINKYPRDNVLAAAETFYNIIQKDLTLLEYDYITECTIPGYEHLSPSRGRGSVGVQIDGRLYVLRGGAGYCCLSLMEIQPDGTGTCVKKIDCRERKIIKTENLGDVKIFRKKKKLTWAKILPPLIDFLKQLEDDQIEVMVIYSKPKFMEYIQAYQEGAGGDDWAIEEIAKMGDEAKNKLLEKLQDPKVRKYYHAIASILMIVFPSKESKNAVERLIEEETDEIRVSLYKNLLQVSGYGNE
jgi:hypothetical protein